MVMIPFSYFLTELFFRSSSLARSLNLLFAFRFRVVFLCYSQPTTLLLSKCNDRIKSNIDRIGVALQIKKILYLFAS